MTPTYRLAEIESWQHQFNITTPAERRSRRGRLIEATLTVALVAAVAVCGFISLSSPPSPGAVPDSHSRAGAPLTAENALVKWQRKDFATSLERVAPATNKTRRGASQPASGSVLKRKVKP